MNIKFILSFFTVFALFISYAQEISDFVSCKTPNIQDKELAHTIRDTHEVDASVLLAGADVLANSSSFTIPVVLHVFHHGEEGKMDMDQALSGLSVINRDFKGENSDWNAIDPEFDSIKGSLNIEFKLAQLDPEGNPTTGVMYYDNEEAMYNRVDLFEYAWENTQYLNIYLPKYTEGEPSVYTGYAFEPSNYYVSNNRDGVFYSSIRWGYGTHSELENGDEWASTATHEIGHWLNLYHTFHNGCERPGDYVDDTPPQEFHGIITDGCGSVEGCGSRPNTSNYMDYYVRCKKMFTKGQVERMTAALYLESRSNLWSQSNLIATGLTMPLGLEEISLKIYPNPVRGILHVEYREPFDMIIYSLIGQEIIKGTASSDGFLVFNLPHLHDGTYVYHLRTKSEFLSGTFLKR